MRRFSGALGLRGHERITGGAGQPVELRWAIPLPRAMAQLAKECLEQAPGGTHKDLFVPKHPSRIESFEAQFAELPSGRVGYVAGGSFASLRRMLLVDAVGPSIEHARRAGLRTLREVGLGLITKEPEHGESFGHLRAALILRHDPSVYTRLVGDAEVWPPPLEELAVLERELSVAPSEASAVRSVPDRATDFALVKDRMLDRLSPQLYLSSDRLDEVVELCARGPLAPRWQLVGHGVRPTSIAGIEDLKSAAGGFVALKMLPRSRLGTFIQEEQAYLVVFSDLAFDRVERHVVDRDQYGTLAGIERGLSEEQLRIALDNELLTEQHEALFPDALPSSLLRGVLCREEADRARLEAALAEARIRTRVVVSDRYLAP